MRLNNSPPYITVVVAARNDNHGGNMLGRMQAFLDAWLGQAKRYDLPSEIIIVEWNAPADRPKLRDSLQWPMDPGPCQVRFIEAPPEVHRRYPNSHVIPLHQMVAKNVGIRRSRGEFVLATNIDIVFSAELMQFLAGRRLEKRALYRMDRYDVSSDIPTHGTLDELLAFCQNNMLRVFTAEGTFEVEHDGLRRLEEKDIVAANQGIRFGGGWHAVESWAGEDEPFRWIGTAAELIFQRPPGSEPWLLMDAEVGPTVAGGSLQLEVVDTGGSPLASATLRGRCMVRLHIPDEITSGSIRLRMQCDSVSLELDPRILNLRVFALRWEASQQLSDPRVAKSKRRASVSVRSLEPRQIQLALDTGEGSSLDSLVVRLTDRAGSVLFQMAADHLRTTPSSEYLLSLDLGFKSLGHEGPVGCIPEHDRPDWFLEMAATRPTVDWRYIKRSCFADQMRTPAYLHTHACGDFTLLSREDWFALRGYAEFPIWPMHIDSLFCYAAHHAGMREVVLQNPMRMFHIEHLSGAGWSPEGEQERIARIEAKGVSVIGDGEIRSWIEHMRRFNAPAIFTGANWGLADVELNETTVARDFIPSRSSCPPIQTHSPGCESDGG